MTHSTGVLFQHNSAGYRDRFDRDDNEFKSRQRGGSEVAKKKFDHYDNPQRDEVEYQKERKTRRKEERENKKQARIEAHQQWVEKRREARKATQLSRGEKRERQEEKEFHKNANKAFHTKPRKEVSVETAERPSHDSISLQSIKPTVKATKKPSSGRSHTAEKIPILIPKPEKTTHSQSADQTNVCGRRGSKGKTPKADPLNPQTPRSTCRSHKNTIHTSANAVKANKSSTNNTDSLSSGRPLGFRAEASNVPPEVLQRTRRCINKITMGNVVALAREISDLFTTSTIVGASRAAVLGGLLEQINHLCLMDTGLLTQTGALPLAGLLRGLQLFHGSHVGAELIERLCFFLQTHLDEATEHAASNLAMVLAYLYLLYGVDARLMVSLLTALFRQIARLKEHLSSITSAADLVVRRALGVASCGLAVLRICGGKLLKEVPQEIDLALREAKRSIEELNNEKTPFSLVRFTVLVDVMGDIVSGKLQKGRRALTEAEAPVEAMLDDLCAILGEASSKNKGSGSSGSLTKRTQRRIIQTSCTLTGVSWELVLQSDKPPRWYAAAVAFQSSAEKSTCNPERKAKSRTNCNSKEEEENSRENSLSSASSSISSAASSGDDEFAQKQATIRKLRQEEKAIAGQRFNTEHKREIFKAVVAAADDLECFSLLIHRDPSYSRFHDVCATLIQCCCQETRYNPYYASILERFCNSKTSCQRKLQFVLWDRFKGIRIEPVNVVTYLNLACLITSLLEHGIFTLSVLRGLDIENTNKTIGLFTRVLILRMLVQLPPNRLTELFFGGDGIHVHDLNTDTTNFRGSLKKFIERYFVDEAMANKWLPAFFDVVAAGTSLDVHAISESANDDRKGHYKLEEEAQKLESAKSAQKFLEFMKRIRISFKALKQGIS
ncbi:unnamed protein product [Phytomonas sp. Hart1]|nr:unnamed protein product [Phytomonas sp. Hart1]|eukprot:CCW68025.1 unnamed protein product [Phytomonas sp. isolate Hart1]